MQQYHHHHHHTHTHPPHARSSPGASLTWFVDSGAASSLPAEVTAAPNCTSVADDQRVIGLIGAMPQEIAKLKENVEGQEDVVVNPSLTVTKGTLHGKPVVFCAAGVGMVAASSVTTTLVNVFNVSMVIFTGVAGGLKEGQTVGDIVVASDVINYDMDVTAFVLPWMPDYKHKRGELPFTSWREFPSDVRLVALAMEGGQAGAAAASFKQGRIVTGSEFVTVERKVALKPVWDSVGDPDAVEMECAAVAQVCKMYGLPFLGLRALSDTLGGWVELRTVSAHHHHHQ